MKQTTHHTHQLSRSVINASSHTPHALRTHTAKVTRTPAPGMRIHRANTTLAVRHLLGTR